MQIFSKTLTILTAKKTFFHFQNLKKIFIGTEAAKYWVHITVVQFNKGFVTLMVEYLGAVDCCSGLEVFNRVMVSFGGLDTVKLKFPTTVRKRLMNPHMNIFISSHLNLKRQKEQEIETHTLFIYYCEQMIRGRCHSIINPHSPWQNSLFLPQAVLWKMWP